MKFYIVHHQHKGKPIDEALRSQGWEFSRKPDIALFDTNHHEKIIAEFVRVGATIVIYPHSSSACWWYDELMPLPPEVKAILVVGEGQKEVQKIITPFVRVEAIGWGYCQIKQFKRPKEIRRILYAPIHPNGHNLRQEAKDANARVFSELLKLKDVQLICRVIGSLKDNGIWDSAKVLYKFGKPDGSTREIDMADLVIGEGMFLSLAVARGKPAIGVNQRVPMRGNNPLHADYPKHWDEYNDLQAYPIDFDDGAIMELIDKALVEPVEWKRRFIGEPLDAKKLSEVLKEVRNEYHA